MSPIFWSFDPKERKSGKQEDLMEVSTSSADDVQDVESFTIKYTKHQKQ